MEKFPWWQLRGFGGAGVTGATTDQATVGAIQAEAAGGAGVATIVAARAQR